MFSRRGKWMGKEEWREISRQRESNVPAAGHLGSPSPSLPTREKWKLLPAVEAMTRGASAQSGERCLPPPSSGNGLPEPPLLTPRAQTLVPQRSKAVARPRSLSPRRCQTTQAGPRALAPPHFHSRPPHTSNPAVGLSLAPFPSQRRSSVAAAAAAATTATESSIPAGATWNSRASRGARRRRGLRPLRRTARLTPAPSRTVAPRPSPTLQNPARTAA